VDVLLDGTQHRVQPLGVSWVEGGTRVDLFTGLPTPGGARESHGDLVILERLTPWDSQPYTCLLSTLPHSFPTEGGHLASLIAKGINSGPRTPGYESLVTHKLCHPKGVYFTSLCLGCDICNMGQTAAAGPGSQGLGRLYSD
jgi:hypothetical protein